MSSPRSHGAAPALIATGFAPAPKIEASSRALVLGAQDGDAEAFGRIFDEWHLPVYRYLAARLGTPADAEDLTADTFAAAFLNIRRFHWGGAPFEAWLFRIARSKFVDHWRTLERHPTRRLDDALGARLASSGDPARDVVWDEEKAELLAAVRRLSSSEQEVIALRFFAELSVPEVGHVMGRSDSAVRQLQFRAVARLRQRMEPDR